MLKLILLDVGIQSSFVDEVVCSMDEDNDWDLLAVMVNKLDHLMHLLLLFMYLVKSSSNI